MRLSSAGVPMPSVKSWIVCGAKPRRDVFRPGGQTEVGDLFDRLAVALVRQQQEGEGLPELISGSTTVERLAADLRADPKAAAFLVRSALDQVAVLYREAEAQKLRGWMAERVGVRITLFEAFSVFTHVTAYMGSSQNLF